jgi:hypothetical protein
MTIECAFIGVLGRDAEVKNSSRAGRARLHNKGAHLSAGRKGVLAVGVW